MVVLSSTETGPICMETLDPDTPLIDGPLPVGPPALDTIVRTVDDAGHALPAGEGGLIEVSSPYLALGYWSAADRAVIPFPADPAGVLQALIRPGGATVDRDREILYPKPCHRRTPSNRPVEIVPVSQ